MPKTTAEKWVDWEPTWAKIQEAATVCPVSDLSEAQLDLIRAQIGPDAKCDPASWAPEDEEDAPVEYISIVSFSFLGVTSLFLLLFFLKVCRCVNC